MLNLWHELNLEVAVRPWSACFSHLVFFLFLSTAAFAEPVAYFSPFDDLEEVTLSRLSKAEKSIDIAIYSFRSSNVRDLLLEKLNEGVRVRILVNDYNQDSVISFTSALVENGAKVRGINKINHHKFIIIDEKVLLNSSENFTFSSSSKLYDGNTIVCSTCKKHIEAFQREFDQLFRFSNLQGDDPDIIPINSRDRERPINYNSDGVALFTSSNFTPAIFRSRISLRDSGEDKEGLGEVDRVLVQEIDEAKESIWVAASFFRSKPLYAALVRAIERGLDVRVTLDGSEHLSGSALSRQNREIRSCLSDLSDNESEFECYKTGNLFSRPIHNAGAKVSLKVYSIRWHFSFAQQMHHKYMIIDSSRVFSGSYNWSYNAEYGTAENVAIYDNPGLVEQFIENFEKISSYGHQEQFFGQLMQTYRDAQRSIPIVFDPMSLGVRQVDALRSKAVRTCPNLYRNPLPHRFCSFK